MKNNSEASANDNQKKPKKQKIKAPKNAILSAIGRGFVILMLVGIITGCIVASVLTVYVLKNIENDEEINLSDIKLNYTSILYAMDEKTGEYYELQRLHGTENRIWVDYGDIPDHMVNAAIALEDKRFRTHNGVDWQRTVMSFVNMFIPIYEGKPGGSTITQQLIKNVTGDDETRIDRKVQEIFRAINLSKRYSRDQIMEAYLNTIALGNGTNGVQAAANIYFGKDVKDISIAEAAAIISITKNPSRFNPFKYPENNKERQEWCLSEMLKQGLITQEEHDAAVAEELVFKKEENIQRITTTQSWFVDNVIEEVLNDLVTEMGYTYSYAEDQLYRGGYRIYTTIDEEMQEYLERKFVVGTDTFTKINNKVYPQGAFVVTDLNGQIKAIAGSNRAKEGARLFNRATQAKRQPGSTIKPIASYTPAIDSNLVTWSTLFNDRPIELTPGDPNSAWPRNFYGYYVPDPITVDYAIRRSVNTVPVQIQTTMGPRVGFDFLKNKLKMSSLVEKRAAGGREYTDIDVAPMALGALTDGVTPLEMAGAYQMFGNGGMFTKPYSYTEVRDSNNNVILKKDITPERVIPADTATVMNKLLQRVTTAAQGTGTPAKFSSMPIAGKTGTSDNDYNQWFIGVTPYYVGVCWLGYDEEATINYSGYSYPPPVIYKNVMGPIHQDLPVIGFPENNNVVSKIYCLESGNIATGDCTQLETGWYKISNVPPMCTGHDSVTPEGEEGSEGDGENSDSSSSDSESESSSSEEDRDYYYGN